MRNKFIDCFLTIILIGVAIFSYDQYIQKTRKVYSVDMLKVFKLKNNELSSLKENGTKIEIDKYFESYEKLVRFSNKYLKNISQKKETVIYTNQAIYGNSIDLTPRIIMELKKRNLL